MIKVSLIGAGNIGTILAYNLSRKQIDKIVMIDVVDGLAQGKCLDLSQSFPIENLNNKVTGSTDINQIEKLKREWNVDQRFDHVNPQM